MPELLFRHCLQPWTREEVKSVRERNTPSKNLNYVSEPASFLLKDTPSERYTYDALRNRALDDDDQVRVDVIFAAVCPNVACKSPILLRVAGPRSEFAAVVRGRKGQPHGKSEDQLRLLHPDEVSELVKPDPDFKRSLELLDTLPRSPKVDPDKKWCGGNSALCGVLNQLEVEKLKLVPELTIRASASEALEQVVTELEEKQVVLRMIDQHFARKKWLFGFMYNWFLGFKNEPVHDSKLIRIQMAKIELVARSKEDMYFEFLVKRLCNEHDPADVNSSEWKEKNEAFFSLEVHAKAFVLGRIKKSGLKRSNYSIRLSRLQHDALLPNHFSHWARRIEREVGLSDTKLHDPRAFFDVNKSSVSVVGADQGFKNKTKYDPDNLIHLSDPSRTAELAVFVRELAMAAFDAPYRISKAMKDRWESEELKIPTN